MIDLDAYLRRVHLNGTVRPDLASLQALQLAHMAAIPFENVDVRLRRPIRLDLDSLEAKLVARRRGGYCFEHNTLFAAVLREIGFEVETLEARVRPRGATVTLPRTHMTLKVELEGRAWLTDVGFGGDGPVQPVPLDGGLSGQWDGAFVVKEEGDGVHVLRREIDGGWHDMYAFTLRPALPVDFEVASYFTSTHPGSPFLDTLTAQRSEARERRMLRGRVYTVRISHQESVRDVTQDEVGTLLREEFHLDVTDDEARRAFGEGLDRPRS